MFQSTPFQSTLNALATMSLNRCFTPLEGTKGVSEEPLVEDEPPPPLENQWKTCTADYETPCSLEQGLVCWFCTLPLVGKPWGLPLKKRQVVEYRTFFTEEQKVQIFRTNQADKEGYVLEGYFCSPSCIVSFVHRESDQVRYRETIPLLLCMSGLHSIEPAPPIFLLQKFGGPLTEDKYRQLKPPTPLSCHSHFDIPLSVVFCAATLPTTTTTVV